MADDARALVKSVPNQYEGMIREAVAGENEGIELTRMRQDGALG